MVAARDAAGLRDDPAGAQPEPTVGYVAATGGPEHFVRGIPVGVRSPDWTHVAAIDNTSGRGCSRSRRSTAATSACWRKGSARATAPSRGRRTRSGSRSSTRAARSRSSAADGTGLTTVAPKFTAHPAWSPNGQLIAYGAGLARTHIHVVKPDGSGNSDVTAGSAKVNVDPVWSPDSTRLAFWRSDARTVLAVAKIGGSTVTYSIRGAYRGDLVWKPSTSIVFGAGTVGLVGIDVTTGKRQTLGRPRRRPVLQRRQADLLGRRRRVPRPGRDLRRQRGRDPAAAADEQLPDRGHARAGRAARGLLASPPRAGRERHALRRRHGLLLPGRSRSTAGPAPTS